MADAEDGWRDVTWEGNRRAQLRRALALTVRERLAALEHLVETSRRLADLRAAPPPGGGSEPLAPDGDEPLRAGTDQGPDPP